MPEYLDIGKKVPVIKLLTDSSDLKDAFDKINELVKAVNRINFDLGRTNDVK